jgi:hypothetical protein|tara:strand:- start:8946 stop:9053 length:108 start_codon:yes stop_codon:yes gene_type:complete
MTTLDEEKTIRVVGPLSSRKSTRATTDDEDARDVE